LSTWLKSWVIACPPGEGCCWEVDWENAGALISNRVAALKVVICRPALCRNGLSMFKVLLVRLNDSGIGVKHRPRLLSEGADWRLMGLAGAAARTARCFVKCRL